MMGAIAVVVSTRYGSGGDVGFCSVCMVSVWKGLGLGGSFGGTLLARVRVE